jgi:hypothetical protein
MTYPCYVIRRVGTDKLLISTDYDGSYMGTPSPGDGTRTPVLFSTEEDANKRQLGHLGPPKSFEVVPATLIIG